MKRNTQILLVMTAAMLIFLVGFNAVFGRDNLIVGITFSLALSQLNKQDVQWRPLKVGGSIFAISILLGILTWIASLSIVLAVIATFVVVYLAAYYLFGDFQSPLFLPVVAGFLYLLASPEPPERVPYRLAAVLAGAALISLALWIISLIKKREGLTELINDLIGEVVNYATATAGSAEIEFVPTPLDDILGHIATINQRLYRQPVRSREMSMITEVRISIVLALERLVMAIDNVRLNHEPSAIERQALADLAGLLEAVQESTKDLKKWQRMEPLFEEFSTKYRGYIDSSKVDATPALFEVISAFDVLTHQIDTIRHLWAEEEVEQTEVRDMFWARELRKIVRPTSLRRIFALKYAITLALVVAIGFFIPSPQYRWVGFTIAFLIRPYVEDTQQRSMVRLGGTLIGIAIFTALFALFENDAILFAAGIAFQIITFLIPTANYYQSVASTLTTMTLVAVASSESGWALSLERLAFVLVGAVIAVVVTNLIRPYRVTIASVDLVERSRHLSYLMLKKVLRMRLDYEETDAYERLAEDARHNIKGTALALNIIEYQLSLNNQIREYEQIAAFIQAQHRLVNDIYFFYASFPHLPGTHEEIDRIMDRFHDLIEQIDRELVRQEGRNTRYGGPDFYALRHTYLDELQGLQRSIDATFGYVEDEDSRLSLNSLGDIVEKIQMPFKLSWAIDGLQ